MQFNLKKTVKFLLTVVITSVITLLIAFLLLGGDISRIAEQTSLLKKVCTLDTKMTKYALNFNSSNEKNGDAIVNAYLSLLDDDKYAFYYSKEEFKEKSLDRKGIADKSIGITIAVELGEKYPTVIYVNRECPAKSAGIKLGDKLVEINNKSLKNVSVEKASDYIKEKDTAEITVKRNGKKIKKIVELGEFENDSVKWRMIGESCVIEIDEFDDATVSQFDEAIEFAKENNAESLVFDLRDNPGGYVNSCAKILDKICPSGDLVKMKNKAGKEKVSFKSDANEIDMPMVVLVNENTASAAEIFAMNIRDYNKGKLVGKKTFGKGIAQTTYSLGDGTAVKFTTETIIDKNGDTYHKKGIEPDVEVDLIEYEGRNNLFLTDDEDSQLQKALEIVNK